LDAVSGSALSGEISRRQGPGEPPETGEHLSAALPGEGRAPSQVRTARESAQQAHGRPRGAVQTGLRLQLVGPGAVDAECAQLARSLVAEIRPALGRMSLLRRHHVLSLVAAVAAVVAVGWLSSPARARAATPSAPVVTVSTTGCPAATPVYRVLLRVWQTNGDDGAAEATDALGAAEASAQGFAAEVGPRTDCAVGVSVQVVSEQTPWRGNDIPAAPRTELVVDRVPANLTPAPGACWNYLAPDTSGAHPVSAFSFIWAVDDAARVRCQATTVLPSASDLMGLLLSAHEASGLPAGSWTSKPTLTVLRAEPTGVLVGIRTVNQQTPSGRYTDPVNATLTAGGRVVASGALEASPEKVSANIIGVSSDGHVLKLRASLKPGVAYKLYLSSPRVGEWEATSSCSAVLLAGDARALLRARVQGERVVLQAHGALVGRRVTVTFIYNPGCPESAAYSSSCIPQRAGRTTVVLRGRETVVRGPAVWARHRVRSVVITIPAFREGGVSYGAVQETLS
jgi:hypothetical protein